MSNQVSQPSVYSVLGKLSAASGITTNANGQPVKRYTKDLVRVGDYYKASTDQSFKFTRESLNEFAASFAAMKAGGVKVPVPSGHTDETDANRGYVEDMFVDGDTLYATIELVGEDAIKLAGRAEVSIYAVPELIDGKGKKYTNVIEHVALVTNPVIPDQGGFVPIAASRGTVQAASFKLSTGDSTMMEIAKALGINVEGMDENAVKDAIMAKINGMSQEKATADEATTKAVEEVKAARSELNALKLSRSAGETNPTVIKLAAKNRTAELSRLTTEGRITPAVRDRLAAAWIGNDNAALKLSLDDASDNRFDEMVKALSENDPKILTEQTRNQAIALSREVPGNDGPSEADAAKQAKKMADNINSKNRR